MAKLFNIGGIDHIVFHVKDLPRARAFYVDFLGLAVERERERQCFLECGSQGIALFQIDRDQDVHGGMEVNHIALRLAAGDRESVKKRLQDAGVEVFGRRNDPGCVYFRDPDGHQLQFLLPNE